MICVNFFTFFYELLDSPSEKSENIIGLDSYVLNRFLLLGPLCQSFGLTALLKLEITFCLFWLSLSAHSGSLKRITDIRNRSVWHTVFFKMFSLLSKELFVIFHFFLYIQLFHLLVRMARF